MFSKVWRAWTDDEYHSPTMTKMMFRNASSAVFLAASLIPLLVGLSGAAVAADKASPAPKVAPVASTSANTGETTLKGEMTCAKCGLHEATKCQNVLRVKDGAGKETRYYLRKNAVAESEHEKVCGGSAPATVTGKVTEEGGKKVVTATSIKFD